MSTLPPSPRLAQAFQAFDEYNSRDTVREVYEGKEFAKELLYADRMTARLNSFAPDASEALQLAARSQHIGRWEIPRNTYPMDRKGYLQWRNELKAYHARIAGDILTSCGYDTATIDDVKFLLLKKELFHNANTQTLEDVICLVFIEYYLEAFAAGQEDDKVVDILRKTLKKMSGRAIEAAGHIRVSERMAALIGQAVKQ
jgi:hypothetical protein